MVESEGKDDWTQVLIIKVENILGSAPTSIHSFFFLPSKKLSDDVSSHLA